MTVAAGFVCLDGVVLCADSQESAGDYKFSVEKLVTKENEHIQVAIAGAGHGALIDMAVSRISRSLLQCIPEDYDFVEDRITEVLAGLYENEFRLCPVTEPEDSIIELLIGIKVKELKRAALYKTYATAVSEVAEHAVIGSGRAVQYQIHKLYNPPEPTRRVIPIAVNLLNVAGVVLRSVGGTGKIVVLHDQEGTAVGTVFGREIDAVTTAMDDLESAAGSLLLDLLDLSKTDADFQATLFEFSSLAINLRVSRVEEERSWKTIWEGLSEALSGKPALEARREGCER